MKETSDYIGKAINLVDEYKNSIPSVIQQATGVVLAPVNWLVQRLIPEEAISGILISCDGLTQMTLTKAACESFEDLEACDRSAESVLDFHKGLTGVGGAVSGLFGLPGLLFDIPTTTLLSIRMIRQIGIEYGYSNNSEDEKNFILSVLAAGSANSQEEKIAALVVNAHVTNIIAKQTWKKISQTAAQNKFSTSAAIIGIKSIAKALGINITKRSALAVLPGIGAVVSASVNVWFMHDVGITAKRLYQERWLKERGFIESPDLP